MGLGSSSRRLMKRSKDVCVCGAAAPSLTINPYSKYAAGLFSHWQQSHDAMQCSDESSTESCIIHQVGLRLARTREAAHTLGTP